MINKKLTVAVSLLILVVLVSGCFGPKAKECPVVVSQSEGLAIKNIQTSYNKIPVGDTVTLETDVQNVGTSKATDVEVTLWSHPGFTISKGSEVEEIDPLSPPNLDVCSAGDVKSMEWSLQAGCDPRKSILAVAAEFDYKSSGWASIYFISGEEREEGEKEGQSGQNVPSAGPIQTKIESLQNEPVTIGEGGNLGVRVKFQNIGSGLVFGTGENKRSNVVSNVSLTVEGPCKFSDDNDGYNESKYGKKKLVWSEDEDSEVVLSSKDQEALKVANLNITGDVIKDYCTIMSEADYRYRIVASTSEKMGITGTASQVEECRESNT